MWVGVVHHRRGRRRAEVIADLLHYVAHGRLELGIAERVDESGEVLPEQVCVLGGRLNQVRHHLGRA